MINRSTLSFPNARYERKFVARAYSLAEALAAVKRHPALFREIYPARTVNNIYFDTPGFKAYYEHVNGSAERIKTRIRWYGPVGGAIEAPTLERKLKCGLVGGKLSYPLQPIYMNGSVPCRQIEDAFGHARIPELLREELRGLRPVLVNRYDRRYFLSGDRAIRLTVDSEIQFFGARGAVGWDSPIRPRPMIVIELKFDPSHADQVARITNHFPFRMTRCSKYVMGIEAIR